MRLLWTLIKVAIALMIALPLAIIALGVTMGILGALFGLAVIMLKFAVIALIGYGAFRLVRGMFGGGGKPAQPTPVAQLSRSDPHYEAAMRELERELGERP